MEEISLKAQEIFHLWGFGLTNSLFLTLLVSLALIFAALISYKKIKIIPGGFQSVVEMGTEWLLGLMTEMLGSVKKAEQYFPLIATFFWSRVLSKSNSAKAVAYFFALYFMFFNL
jgi:F0F1-type ATP synthase membrane subunit a